MKLWLLDRGGVDYDECSGFVVRAESREEAVQLANELCGDEGPIWGDVMKADCEELTANGPAVVILSAFRAG